MKTAEELLDWMTHHHSPLCIYRTLNEWEVADNSTDLCIGSGETVFDALQAAYRTYETPNERP